MQQKQLLRPGHFFMGLLILAFIALMVVFVLQTYSLVSTLFPEDNVFMQWATVFSFDGCCVIYAGLEMFYPFKWEYGKEITKYAWWATFIGSLLCTIAYMNLASDHLLHQIVNVNLLYTLYVVVTVVFCGNILTIAILIRSEYAAHMVWKYGKGAMSIPPSPAPRLQTSVREAPQAFQGALPQPKGSSNGQSGQSGMNSNGSQQKQQNQHGQSGQQRVPVSLAQEAPMSSNYREHGSSDQKQPFDQ